MAVYLILIAGLLYNSFPHSAYASTSFSANFDTSLTANEGTDKTAYNDSGTAQATLVEGENGGSDQAAQILTGQTLKYTLANNVDPTKGEISFKFKAPFNINADDMKGRIGGYTAYGGTESHENMGGVDYDSVNNDLYISDGANNRIIKAKLDGNGEWSEWQSFGGLGAGVGQFSANTLIQYSDGYIFVLDKGNKRVVRTKIDGSGWKVFGEGILTNPVSFYYDSGSQIIYITDANKVYRGNTNESVLESFGGTGSGEGKFSSIGGIYYNPSDSLLYISDTNKLVKSDWGGTATWETTTANGHLSGKGDQLRYIDGLFYLATGTGVITKFNWSGSTYDQSFPPPSSYNKSGFFGYSASYFYFPYQDWDSGYHDSQPGIAKCSWDWEMGDCEYYGKGMDASTSLRNIKDIFYDQSTGYFYFTVSGAGDDGELHYIGRFREDGSEFRTLGLHRNYPSVAGTFKSPTGIVAYGEDIYVCDGDRIVKTQIDGTGWQSWTGKTGQLFNGLKDLSYNPATGYFYIVDYGNAADGYKHITKTKWLDAASNWTRWGAQGTGLGQFSSPTDIQYDLANDDIYVMHGTSNNNKVVRTNFGDTNDWTALDISIAEDPDKFALEMTSADRNTHIVYTTSYEGIWKFNFQGGFFMPDTRAGYPDYLPILSVPSISNKLIMGTTGPLFTNYSDTSSDYTPDFGPKTLFKTSGSNPMWLNSNSREGCLEFYPAYGESALVLKSPTLNLSKDTWHTVNIKYISQKGTLEMRVNGTLVRSVDADPWATPSHLGTSFYLGSDSSSALKAIGGQIDDFTAIKYTDSTPPTTPTLLSKRDSSGGSVDLDPETWYKHASPYFSWNPSDDLDHPEDPQQPASGLAGYYVYFGSDINADPEVTSGVINASGSAPVLQSTTNVSIAGTLTSGLNYLRIVAKDNDNNKSAPATLFTYKYDVTAPTNPSKLTASPSGFTTLNDFTFYWTAGSDQHSGISHYEYRIKKSDGTYTAWIEATELQADIIDQALQGTNVFYLKTIDALDNVSSEIMTNFLYSGTAPSKPVDLGISSPASPEGRDAEHPSLTNSFSFSWTAPTIDSENPPILRYRYSINELPQESNTFTTTNTSLPLYSYATRQGKNTLYVVAEDTTNNINYEDPASVDFYAQTPAPDSPEDVSVFDISNRDKKQYLIVLNWTAPENLGTGFDAYYIYRCINDKAHSKCTDSEEYTTLRGTTPGTTFVDSDLTSDEEAPYSYMIKARDNANQYSMPSLFSDPIVPTGRYTTPPKIDGEPSVTTKSYSAQISWKTIDDAAAGQTVDAAHTAQGFIYYSTKKEELGAANGAILAEPDYSNDHSMQIPDLQPETSYWYQLVWKDIDGKEGTTEPSQFVTGKRPSISEVVFDNIGLNKATVSWKSSLIVDSKVNYSLKGGGDIKSIVESSDSSEHIMQLSELNHSSVYRVYIAGFSEEGKVINSDEYEFSTLTQPLIVGNEVLSDQIKEAVTTTYRFSWKTNIPTTSVIYYNREGEAKSSVSNADYLTDHSISVSSLADLSNYTFEIGGMDQYGNTVKITDSTGNIIDTPRTISIQTPLDSRPPKVSNLTIEVKSAGFGETQKAQIVAAWETDEPATSQIEYEQGISGQEYANQSKEDTAYSTSHVVILSELEPSKIYHLRALSKDPAGNKGNSDDTTVITGKVQKSILDIIVNSLERSLGWVFKVFK